MRFLFLVVVIMLSACGTLPQAGKNLWSRDGREQAALFGDRPVDIRLRVDMKELEKTLKERRFITGDLVYKGMLWGKVGIRYRGGVFSRARPKRAFKIKFTTVKGRRFHGLKRLNFNMQRNDPSYVREKIVCEALRQLGVPAPRIGYVRLYVNGRYRGLYLNVEQIDDAFVAKRFGRFDGILYKAGWPACFRFKPGTRMPEVGVFPVKDLYPELEALEKRVRALQKKIRNAKQKKDTLSVTRLGSAVRAVRKRYMKMRTAPLEALITVLNTRSGENLLKRVSPLFDIDAFLKVLAVHAYAAAWDNYYMTPGNFYLYWDRGKNRFHWIAYDYDNTLGIDFFGINWVESSLLYFTPRSNGPEERVLIDRLLVISSVKKRFLAELMKVAHAFRPALISRRATALQALIDQDVRREMESRKNYPKPPGLYGLFTRTLEHPVKIRGHHFAGLLPFVRSRYRYVQGRLKALEEGRVDRRPFRNASRGTAMKPDVLFRDRVYPGGEHWYEVGFPGKKVALVIRSRSRAIEVAIYSGSGSSRRIKVPPFQGIYHIPAGEGKRYIRIMSQLRYPVPVEMVVLPALPPGTGGEFRLAAAAARLIGRARKGQITDPSLKRLRVIVLERKNRRWKEIPAGMKRQPDGTYRANLRLAPGKWMYQFRIPGFGPLPDVSETRLQWRRFSLRIVKNPTK